MARTTIGESSLARESENATVGDVVAYTGSGFAEWQTPTGGTATITEITSEDESVTITGGTGPVVDLSAPGGSQPLASPLDIDDCQLWLDASTLGLADNAAVALWPDGSVNGWDGVQATAANQPVYKTAIRNGLGVVRFNGEDVAGSKFLDFAGAVGILNGKPGLTLAYVIGNENAYTNYATTLYVSVNGDATKWRYTSHDAGVLGSTDDGDGDNRFSINNVLQAVGSSNGGFLFASPAFVPTIFRADLAAGGVLLQRTSSGEVALYDKDKAAIAAPQPFSATIANQGPPAFAATNSALVRVGERDPVGNGYGLVGDIAELIVYDRALNSRETRELMEYLSDKWGTI
jgi:hypothetical protein